MVAEDRISALSDSLIHHILSFLLIDQAIATSSLSRRWRHLWASVPYLNFGSFRRNDSLAFISHTLLRFEAPKIHMFQLQYDFKGGTKKQLDSWMHFAIARGMQELDLQLSNPDRWEMDLSEDSDVKKRFYSMFKDQKTYVEGYDDGYQSVYVMPNRLLDCQTLVVLRLAFCELNSHHKPLRLCSLKVLDLLLVGLNDLDTSGCPLLEDVMLRDCCAIKSFRIWVPSLNLKHLDMHNCFHDVSDVTIDAPHLLSIEVSGDLFGKYNINNASSITTVTLAFMGYQIETATLLNLLESLSHAKSINLCEMCLQVLSQAENVKLKRSIYFSASNLELDTSLTESNVSRMVCLLRNFDNELASLTLNIRLEEDFKTVLPYESKYWTKLGLIFSRKFHLKNVKINNFMSSACSRSADYTGIFSMNRVLKECEMQMKLVTLLVQSCKVLEELRICCVDEPRLRSLPRLSEFIKTFKNLLDLQKASANTKIYIS